LFIICAITVLLYDLTIIIKASDLRVTVYVHVACVL